MKPGYDACVVGCGEAVGTGRCSWELSARTARRELTLEDGLRGLLGTGRRGSGWAARVAWRSRVTDGGSTLKQGALVLWTGASRRVALALDSVDPPSATRHVSLR